MKLCNEVLANIKNFPLINLVIGYRLNAVRVGFIKVNYTFYLWIFICFISPSFHQKILSLSFFVFLSFCCNCCKASSLCFFSVFENSILEFLKVSSSFIWSNFSLYVFSISFSIKFEFTNFETPLSKKLWYFLINATSTILS